MSIVVFLHDLDVTALEVSGYVEHDMTRSGTRIARIVERVAGLQLTGANHMRNPIIPGSRSEAIGGIAGRRESPYGGNHSGAIRAVARHSGRGVGIHRIP
jgi:hypothetical protein